MVKIRGPQVIKSCMLIICGLTALLIFVSLFFNTHTLFVLNSINNSMKSISSMKLDYTQLMDMDFQFKMLPIDCNKSEELLLTLIHSSPNHFNHRKVIRETWGRQDEGIRFLFLVGAVEDTTLQEKLIEESKVHSDIMQGNFLDNYHNLTYKHVMALKYANYHCPKVQFILKVDDDVFINIPTVKILLKSFICEKGHPVQIMCSKVSNNPVLREGKWATSLEEFPESYYPTHCSGFIILYPRNVIHPLYTQAQKTNFFWVDDVFVSGICARNSKISHIGIENLILSGEDVREIVDLSFTNITKPFLTGSLNLNEKQIRSLWKFVEKYKSKTILEYLRYD